MVSRLAVDGGSYSQALSSLRVRFLASMRRYSCKLQSYHERVREDGREASGRDRLVYQHAAACYKLVWCQPVGAMVCEVALRW